MAIVSSVLAEVNIQSDGRRWVHERHTDNTGLVFNVEYLADAAANLVANLAAHATAASGNQTVNEIASNLIAVGTMGSLAIPTFVYSTVAQNVVALRAAYATATQTQVVFLGDYLNSLTNAALQTAFGMTAGQVATIRTNQLAPAAILAASIRAAVGQ